MKNKFYKQVSCKACLETGKGHVLKININFPKIPSETIMLRSIMGAQGICMGCFGKGTQTILEREEGGWL